MHLTVDPFVRDSGGLASLHEFSDIQWLWHALVWTDMAACMHIWAMAHSHLESNLPVQNTHGKPSIS